MIKITEINKHCFILTDEAQDATALANLFEPNYLQQNNLIIGSAMGRAKVNIFDFKQQHNVLRHYRRGGLVSKILDDHYAWTGLKNTRAYKEFDLLLKLQALGLPTSPPLAARVKRSGLTYSADLITLHVAETETLATRLTTQNTAPWQAIGETIALFHNNQIYHDDLNAHNILINKSEEIFIIDFDKGKVAKGKQWQPGNLERLHRSLRKVKPSLSSDSYWPLITQGYHNNK